VPSERTSLSPSGWTFFYRREGSRVRLAGLLPLPLCILGAFLGFEWLVLSGFVLTVTAQLLALRGDRDAFFTPVRVHCRSGLLGLVMRLTRPSSFRSRTFLRSET
jgi:hypothetical protein